MIRRVLPDHEWLRPTPDRLLLIVDFLGTLVFAVEGGMAAVAGHLDLLGAVALAVVTAVGGGIIRDLLIGAIPPNSIRDWRYGAVAFLGAAVAFFCIHWCWRHLLHC